MNGQYITDLFQCAAVNFVTGVGATQASCKNESSTTASFVADAALSSLPSTATASATSSGTATSSPTSSTKPSAANSNYGYSGLGMLAWVMVVGSASFLACLL
jgi:hypothetical protein